jgi:transcriptional regulator with GAF, ATPase, and Fis domain
VQAHSDLCLAAAAAKLGIAPATLRKACRRLGIQCWPPVLDQALQ